MELRKHLKQTKIIIAVILSVCLIAMALVLHFWTHVDTVLLCSIIGLSCLFIGNIFLTDALGKWGAHNLWTYKYGNALQGIGFVLSLIGLLHGAVHFKHSAAVAPTSDWVTAWASVALAAATFIGVAYAILQYSLGKHEREEKSRPYIFVDLERVTSGLFDLVIRNNGASPALNIKIEFTPDIKLHDHSQTTINNMKIMQNMKFLAPGRFMQFYFGSVMGGNTVICQEFQLSISYENSKGRHYTTQQVIDPRDYLELSNIGRKDIDDIGKSLEDIAKYLKEASAVQRSIGDTLSTGVTVLNAGLDKLSEEELFSLLKGIAQYAQKYEVVIPSKEYIKVLARALREKYLTKTRLTKVEKERVSKLGILIGDHFPSGGAFEEGPASFDEALKDLTGEK